MPLKSIYGNLPYVAPEVIIGIEYTFASDIYSVAMLMWEISSGKQPFANYEINYELAMKIVNGMRPKIVPGTPLEYKELMEQCWDADPLKRPDINSLAGKINEMNFHYQNISSELTQSIQQKVSNDLKTSSKLLTSKVHQFENMPEPKNATEGNFITYYHQFIFYLLIISLLFFNNRRTRRYELIISILQLFVYKQLIILIFIAFYRNSKLCDFYIPDNGKYYLLNLY